MNYNKNMVAIEARIPQFSNLINNDPGVDWIDEIQEINGDTNVVVRTATAPFKINQVENAVQNAKEKTQENEYHNDACTVIFGIGTGYFVKAVLDVMKTRHVVIVIEPVMAMLKIALHLNDYTEAINRGSLLFACTREDLDYQLSLIENNKSISQWIIVSEDYVKHRPEEYSHLLQHTLMLITQLKSNTGTVASAGRLIAKNDILNLPYVIKHRGVAELKDLYKGKPAILVSTGPSLQKNIHLLVDKDVQKRFVIIAVGQALRILLSYDIKPDFICSVDFGPVNFGHYKGLLDTKDIPLVSINRTYQPILKHWEGPKFISVSLDGLSAGTLSEFMAHKGGLLQGGSVAHMNFGLAILMGCDPIIMLGQDLAYEDDGRSHHSLTDEAGSVDIDENGIKWSVDDPRSEIQGVHDMGPVQVVNGYFGQPVRTNSGYVSFISTFERMFRQFKGERTIINATEGGARLEGAEQMTLEEVIETYGGPKVAADLLNKDISWLLTEVDNSKGLITESIDLIKSDIKELKDIVKSSQRSLVLLKRLKVGAKNTDRKKFAKRLKENYELTIRTKKLVDKSPLVSMSVFWASKTIAQNKYSNARQEIKDRLNDKKQANIDYFYTPEGKEVLAIRIEANEIVMTASRDSAKDLLEAYEETLETMEELEEKGELVYDSINPPPHLNDAETYFKNGNWGHNLIEATRMVPPEDLLFCKGHTGQGPINEVIKKCLYLRRKAIETAKTDYNREGKDKVIKYNHFLELAHKEGRNQKEGVSEKRNFQRSLFYLNKAVEFDSDRPEAKWGMATTYHGLGDIEQSKDNTARASEYQSQAIETYLELIGDYPDNLQFKFELGLVYLRVGFGADADKQFNQIFKATDAYDFFLKNLANLYFKTGMIEEAQIAIDCYTEKFPFDSRGKQLQEDIYK